MGRYLTLGGDMNYDLWGTREKAMKEATAAREHWRAVAESENEWPPEIGEVAVYVLIAETVAIDVPDPDADPDEPIPNDYILREIGEWRRASTVTAEQIAAHPGRWMWRWGRAIGVTDNLTSWTFVDCEVRPIDADGDRAPWPEVARAAAACGGYNGCDFIGEVCRHCGEPAEDSHPGEVTR